MNAPCRTGTPPLILERELVLRAAEGDALAREQLVENFLPHISAVARRYRTVTGVDREELVQEGVVGLLRALERYDPGLGLPFWPYASWWVRQAMQRLVAELTHPTVLSDRALRQLARIRAAHQEHVQANGREPSIAELAGEAGLAKEQVQTLVAVDRPARGIDEPAARNLYGAGSFAELLADPRAEDDFERLAHEEEIAEVRTLTRSLGAREREILRARYGFDGSLQTLRQIGNRLGLSAERVRQIEERALGKLRDSVMAA
jgi:RNA polymerase primary sigma factor